MAFKEKILDVSSRNKITHKLKGLIETASFNFNSVLQIGAEFQLHKVYHLKGIPKFSYHDNNVSIYFKAGFDATAIKEKNKYRQNFEKAFNFEKEVYDHLDGIFVMTPFHRRSFIDDFDLLPEKVHDIGYGSNIGIDQEIVNYKKDYANHSILFVAKDSFEKKGGVLLINAFKIVKKKYKDAKLVIVGPKQSINEDGIFWEGMIDKRRKKEEERLKNIYRNSSLFVLPGFGEPAGVAFLEAMSFKLPIIGAAQGATPTIILDNNCGLVIEKRDHIELADKIITLFENEKLMEEFGRNSLDAINKKYNWETVCEKAARIIRSHL